LTPEGVEAPEHATLFEFPESSRWGIIVGLIFSYGLIAGGILVPLLTEQLPRALLVGAACVTVSGLFAFAMTRNLRTLRSRVAVTDDCIGTYPSEAHRHFSDGVKSQPWEMWEGRLQGRLILSDAARLKSINLDYRLNNFARVFGLVLNKTAERRLRLPYPCNFHRNYSNRAFMLIASSITVAVALLSAHEGYEKFWPWFAIIAALGALGFGGLILEPRGIVVSARSFTIQYPGWRRTVPFDAVTDIRITLHRGGKGELTTPVMADLAARRRLKLVGFREGSVALYDALYGAWQAGRRAESWPGAEPKP
jgi:hypothetical protein